MSHRIQTMAFYELLSPRLFRRTSVRRFGLADLSCEYIAFKSQNVNLGSVAKVVLYDMQNMRCVLHRYLQQHPQGHKIKLAV
jgi:hypothetical protein